MLMACLSFVHKLLLVKSAIAKFSHYLHVFKNLLTFEPPSVGAYSYTPLPYVMSGA